MNPKITPEQLAEVRKNFGTANILPQTFDRTVTAWLRRLRFWGKIRIFRADEKGRPFEEIRLLTYVRRVVDEEANAHYGVWSNEVLAVNKVWTKRASSGEGFILEIDLRNELRSALGWKLTKWKCSKCGQEFEDKDKNCWACGTPRSMPLQAAQNLAVVAPALAEVVPAKIQHRPQASRYSKICPKCSRLYEAIWSKCQSCNVELRSANGQRLMRFFIAIGVILISLFLIVSALYIFQPEQREAYSASFGHLLKGEFGRAKNDFGQAFSASPVVRVFTPNSKPSAKVSSRPRGVARGEPYTVVEERPLTPRELAEYNSRRRSWQPSQSPSNLSAQRYTPSNNYDTNPKALDSIPAGVWLIIIIGFIVAASIGVGKGMADEVIFFNSYADAVFSFVIIILSIFGILIYFILSLVFGLAVALVYHGIQSFRLNYDKPGLALCVLCGRMGIGFLVPLMLLMSSSNSRGKSESEGDYLLRRSIDQMKKTAALGGLALMWHHLINGERIRLARA